MAAVLAASMRASRRGLPISSIMSCAMSSTRASIAAAAFVSTAPRAAIGIPDHPGNASAAAATAASTPSAFDAGNSPIGSEGWAGLRFSYVLPERLGSHSPPTKLANAGRAGACRVSDMGVPPKVVEARLELLGLPGRELVERRAHRRAAKAGDDMEKVLHRGVARVLLGERTQRRQEGLPLLDGVARADGVELVGDDVGEERDRAGRADPDGVRGKRVGARQDGQLREVPDPARR